MDRREHGIYMLLVIGGSFQGKLEYVKEQYKNTGRELLSEEIADGDSLALRLSDDKWQQIKVVHGLHLFVYQQLKKQLEAVKAGSAAIPLPDALAAACERQLKELLAANAELVLICDEVGYGIVPLDETERCYREAVGRLLCSLAKQADGMVRIVGGLPIRIK